MESKATTERNNAILWSWFSWSSKLLWRFTHTRDNFAVSSMQISYLDCEVSNFATLGLVPSFLVDNGRQILPKTRRRKKGWKKHHQKRRIPTITKGKGGVSSVYKVTVNISQHQSQSSFLFDQNKWCLNEQGNRYSWYDSFYWSQLAMA